ncbi:unnamed protein product [Prorocentrum cordatum]|uniref:Uncharacterized protein n=1 Tax=Prorocentrum cordatum TaxID=2364126 RepID=A0ABN9X420_9DINO|nr:unnamed protein product [Polarella glacialis]
MLSSLGGPPWFSYSSERSQISHDWHACYNTHTSPTLSPVSGPKSISWKRKTRRLTLAAWRQVEVDFSLFTVPFDTTRAPATIYLAGALGEHVGPSQVHSDGLSSSAQVFRPSGPVVGSSSARVSGRERGDKRGREESDGRSSNQGSALNHGSYSIQGSSNQVSSNQLGSCSNQSSPSNQGSSNQVSSNQVGASSEVGASTEVGASNQGSSNPVCSNQVSSNQASSEVGASADPTVEDRDPEEMCEEMFEDMFEDVCQHLLQRPHVDPSRLRAYMMLFPKYHDDGESSDSEFESAQTEWVVDFLAAYTSCPQEERDHFLHEWADLLEYGCYPDMLRTLQDIVAHDGLAIHYRSLAQHFLGRLLETMD